MLIYYMLMGFWGVISLLFLKITYPLTSRSEKLNTSRSTIKLRKLLILIYTLSLVIIIGCRSTDVGSDTYLYSLEYMKFNSFSFDEINISLKSEFGYKLLQIFFNLIGAPWQLYLILTSIIIVFPYSILTYKYSRNVFFPFFLYLTIGIFAMNMTGIRQSIAVSICLLAFLLLEKKKDFAFFIVVAIATTVHYSAFVFFIIYPICKLEYKDTKHLTLVLLAPIIVRFFSSGFNYVFSMLATDKQLATGYFSSVQMQLNPLAEAIPWVILISVYIIFLLFPELRTKENCLLFVITGIYVSCYELSHALYIATRLSFYFAPFMLILISNVFPNIKTYNEKIIVLSMILICSILFFTLSIPGSSYSIDNYSFFIES